MHALTSLLIVIVLGGGGPHGARPSRLADAVVKVTHAGRFVASGRSGRLDRRLAPGTYRVSAALQPPGVLPCQSRTVVLRAGRTAHVRLFCTLH
jgi:hypothetical protein